MVSFKQYYQVCQNEFLKKVAKLSNHSLLNVGRILDKVFTKALNVLIVFLIKELVASN